MRQSVKILLFVILVISFVSRGWANSYGVLDLFEWNPKEPRTLLAKWTFFPGKHIWPSDTVDGYYYTRIGKTWNDELSGDTLMGSYGYGTYRLQVVLPEKDISYGLDLGSVGCAYALYVDNNLVKQVGNPYGTKSTYLPDINTKVARFTPDDQRVTITVHVANFDYYRGGLWNDMRLSLFETAHQERKSRVSFILVLFGGILIMSLYHGGLYILRRKERSSLFFFLWTFAAAFRLLFSGRYYPALDISDISFELIIRIEYFTYYAAIPLFLQFVAELFPKCIDRLVLRAVLIFGGLASLIVLVAPMSFFTQTVMVYQVFTMLCIGYAFLILYRMFQDRQPGRFTFLLGFSVLSLTVVHDILAANYLVQGNWFSAGLLFFVVSQAYLLASRFTSTFARAEVLSRQMNYMNLHLEKIVDERTEKLKHANEELKQKNEEVSRQSDQMAIMNKELRKLSVAASETDNAIIITDKKGQIEWVNRGFERLYGYSLSEMHRRFGSNLKRAGQKRDIERLFNQVVENRKSVNYESSVEAHDGKQIQVQTTLSPIMDADNELIYLVAIDTDIRELKAVQKELKKSNKAKNKLFSIIAHDLRSPFNSLLGLTELVLARYEELSSEELLQFLNDLNEVSQKTYYLLLNLLEWSRTQRDKIEIHPAQYNLLELVNDTLGLFTTSLGNKNLKLYKRVPEDIPVFVDMQSFNTVLRNLISNAIKFTPRNKSIYIDAQLKDNDVEISISDEGIGIAPDNLKNLFNTEETYSSEGTEQEKGTGLGLMLCRSFVEKNNGTIEAQSKVGHGTTFMIRLPAFPTS